jgi:Ca-activated chloride channel family protein
MIGFCLLLAAGLCTATERVEIVLDTSMEMWKSFPNGTPRIVAVRTALDAFVTSPAASGRNFVFGLRTIGGRSDISEASGCSDSESLIAGGPVDPARWTSALANVEFKGGRALVFAVEEAIKDLSSWEGEKRIVVLSSGGDQCYRDLAAFVDGLAEAENPIAIRVIGLGMDQKLANSLVLSTPTRNINDPGKLLETIRWAAAPQTAASNRAEWIDLMITLDGTPMDGATLFMVDRNVGEEVSTAIVDGTADLRLTLGRYRARIEGTESGVIQLDDIMHLDTRETVAIDLSSVPPVTLEVIPERPLAGDEAQIHYWGAPAGANRVAVAKAGAPTGHYLSRIPVVGTTGEVTISLPDSPNELELQFTRDIGSGMQQLLGRFEFVTNRRRVAVEAPEQVEIQTPMTVTWNGGGLPGDHIIVEHVGDERREDVLCIPVSGAGPVTVSAPDLAGDYVVRYRSRVGQSLARSPLEIFEILATIEAPTNAGPGEKVTAIWTGPAEGQDFLSIAAPDEPNEHYRSFSPTRNGSPAELIAPISPGEYEIRYVRAADGEILARHSLEIVKVDVRLVVPPAVEAGTRFEVAWEGTAGEGDFVTIAHPRSGPERHLDWSYTDLGSPVTLAAPFEAGTYIVRYVSGTTDGIVARRKIQVR